MNKLFLLISAVVLVSVPLTAQAGVVDFETPGQGALFSSTLGTGLTGGTWSQVPTVNVSGSTTIIPSFSYSIAANPFPLPGGGGGGTGMLQIVQTAHQTPQTTMCQAKVEMSAISPK